MGATLVSKGRKNIVNFPSLLHEDVFLFDRIDFPMMYTSSLFLPQ